MTKFNMVGRRAFMLGGMASAALGLAGCASAGTPHFMTASYKPKAKTRYIVPDEVLAMYAARPDEKFPIPAARIDLVDPRYWRQMVENPTGEEPGKVVVDTPNRFLYWTMTDGKAMRYGVGIGRDGFSWGGDGYIPYKREWPTWTPPAEMIARQPEVAQYAHGMAPSLDNPLGPRALYIFQNKQDTLYRLHGNMDAKSIGQAVSSGCVRLLFQDVIDLYGRVPAGSRIKVLQ